MDQQQILAIYDREQRRDVIYNDSIREEDGDVVRHRPREEGGGFVLYSRLTAATADAQIAAQLAYFRALNCGFEWKLFSHDTPADLAQRLAAHGLVLDEREAVLVMDLAHGPPPPQTGTLDVRRITTPAGIDDAMAVEEAVWLEDKSLLGTRLKRDLDEIPDQFSLYVAYVDGVPAAAAWIYFHLGTQFASLWGGSTIARFRKQGLYSELLAMRVAEARERGFRFLTVDASEMSRPILQKHGFMHLTDAYAFRWSPAAQAG